jgi:hypothetical protein
MPQGDIGKPLAIGGMVCGIVSLVFNFFLAPLALILAIVGLVLSVMAMGKLKAAGQPAGMAIAGLVCSIVAIPFALICSACWICSVCMGNAVDSAVDSIFGGLW